MEFLTAEWQQAVTGRKKGVGCSPQRIGKNCQKLHAKQERTERNSPVMTAVVTDLPFGDI
jgi:hypothetical protein